MIEIINEIFSNRMLFIVGVIYGVPITIALILLFFVKSSRDERGRAIIGKASIIAMIVFILLVDVYKRQPQRKGGNQNDRFIICKSSGIPDPGCRGR